MKTSSLCLPFDGKPAVSVASKRGAAPIANTGIRTAQEARKDLGAFYTEGPVVSFLVSWETRVARRRVFDPSCGDGRFLEAALRRGAGEVVGCDVDPAALAQAQHRCGGVDFRLIRKDFFSLDPGEVPPVDLIVGNPPFIRYQRFSGEPRRRALATALRLGVRLTGLTSSWAPFLLHAVQFLEPGGDVAMVVPAEVCQTQYGLPTLRALAEHFESISLLAFERNLFPDAQEETLLLLASGFGRGPGPVHLVPLRGMCALEDWGETTDRGLTAAYGLRVGHEREARFAEAFLEPGERAAFEAALTHPQIRRLGTLGVLANGYVTGDNKFFHRTRAAAADEGLPEGWLRPAARSSRSPRGAFFTRQDLNDLEDGGAAHHLVVPATPGTAGEAAALARFAAEGERRDVHQRYKCRARNPWWRVPGLAHADVLLAYMSGTCPRAAVNAAGALYTNSLHGLRLADPSHAGLLVLSFHTSLTLLSLELQGRSYGGGIFKLEPTEMLGVQLAWPRVGEDRLAAALNDADRALRRRELDAATAVADRLLLEDALGVGAEDVAKLRSGRVRLVRRRTDRTKGIVQRPGTLRASAAGPFALGSDGGNERRFGEVPRPLPRA